MKRYRVKFEGHKNDTVYIVHVSATDVSDAYDKALYFLFKAYGEIIWHYCCTESNELRKNRI